MSPNAVNKQELQESFQKELNNILDYWMTHTIDEQAGGFYGEVDDDNHPVPGAAKGAVLNARILWTFSAAYNLLHKNEYLTIAKRALTYIRGCFIDPVFDGVYWSVTENGKPADTKKQIYALSFTIYGLSEYYKATSDEEALSLAISIYHVIEKYSFDDVNGGYLEAFTREHGTGTQLTTCD
jgi:mannobiose 2-epimerase